jgi:hypothetical protein
MLMSRHLEHDESLFCVDPFLRLECPAWGGKRRSFEPFFDAYETEK